MKYHFLDQTLDTKTSELINSSGSNLLKKKPFLLLQCLVKNSQQIVTKDFLLKEVWNDRLVSDNTIAQTVAQLRQLIETDSKDPKIIVTHRGRGITFTPEVTSSDNDSANQELGSSFMSSKNVWIPAALIICMLAFLWWFNAKYNLPRSSQLQAAPNLLFLSTQQTDASETWLQNSVPQLFSSFLGQQYTGKVTAEQFTTQADVDNFLNNQWTINPNLNVVTTHLVDNEFGYSFTLNFTQESQTTESQRFSGDSINNVLLKASDWLGEELQTETPDQSSFLPNDPAVAELYMRGLNAENDSQYDKASQYYQLVLTEQPDFHRARLQLANVNKHQGDYDSAFVQLDTLENTAIYPQVELQAVSIRCYIYDIQGRFDEAKILFEETLNKYANAPSIKINPLRFELSYIFTGLNQPEQALQQLALIEQTTTLASDALLLADTLHKKASIIQSKGQTTEALSLANQALSIYLKLDKPLGVAKANNLLARVYTLKSNYEKAKYYLFETLTITRNVDYKLGIGAAINELVYILIREGNFDQAEELNAEMEQIAIEIDYTHMLIAAKQHAATLAIKRKKWSAANQYIQQQEQLANSSNNQTALMSGRLLQLEYWIAQDNSEGAGPILSWLVERIDQEKNIRQHIELSIKQAELKLIDGQLQSAIDLLISVKSLAKASNDQQALVEINNLLTQLYLYDNAEKALTVIKENTNLNPIDYPYLLLYSKALKANNKLEQSLAVAIECKNNSGQNWSRQDEAYLSQLRLLID